MIGSESYSTPKRERTNPGRPGCNVATGAIPDAFHQRILRRPQDHPQVAPAPRRFGPGSAAGAEQVAPAQPGVTGKGRRRREAIRGGGANNLQLRLGPYRNISDHPLRVPDRDGNSYGKNRKTANPCHLYQTNTAAISFLPRRERWVARPESAKGVGLRRTRPSRTQGVPPGVPALKGAPGRCQMLTSAPYRCCPLFTYKRPLEHLNESRSLHY